MKWDKDSRYARFCHYLPTKRERYESFYPYHESILKWLRGEREAALLAIQARMKAEYEEAEKAVA